MRRFAAIVLFPAATACASADPEPGLSRAPARETIMVSTAEGQSQGILITRQNYVSRAPIQAPQPAVWRALSAAYADLGLPAPVLDNGRYVAAVQHHRVAFRLGQERLSRFFECGMGPTGLNADQRALRISLHVAVLPESGGVTPVEIRAEAVSQSTEGASTRSLPCSSSGLLEQRLTTALQLRALQAPRH
jgi:hypothetical protein